MQSSDESEMLCNVHGERNAQTGDVFMVVVKREMSRKFWKNEAKKDRVAPSRPGKLGHAGPRLKRLSDPFDFRSHCTPV